MIYVMSDIHGCYDQYTAMLKKIDFNKDDTLYILGDIVDRGNEPMKVMLDMMERDNIIPILGNHDFLFKKTIEVIPYKCDIDNFMEDMDDEELKMLSMWVMDGGRNTLERYLELTVEQKHKINEYLDTYSIYKEIKVNDKDYLLTHSGLDNFDEKKELSEYTLMDFLFHRPNDNTKFYDDKMLIFGHTPTMIFQKGTPKIHKTPTYIDIDCGCVFGGRLACLELDTMKEYYV